ncbi:MAG TPA: transketolase [Solirubrobacterales bacterium]|nr:transketolase [Solirubrobacterales bacterium]
MSITTEVPTLVRADLWRELGQQLRVDAIRATAVSGSGHPTSAMSAADLIAVLAEKYLRYDFDHPDHPNNDHLIFSKGHASPLLYALYKAAGAISDEELLTTRTLGSPLEGHPSAALPWVDVATGSLGFGLPVGVGIALAAKTVDARPYRVWVLAGDSEMAEGSVWEAFEHAAHWQLDTLTVILDVNRLGQSGETMHGWDLDSYLDRARSFGWAAFPVDGHDVEAIDRAYTLATAASERPSLIVARTVKGKGVAAVENQPGWHGKVLPDTEAAIVELGGMREIHIAPSLPPDGPPRRHYEAAPITLPAYELGTMKATRRAYGEALATLGDARDDVVTMDGEVSNSTFSGLFAERHPERFFEMFVAEQQMIAAAIGFGVRGLTPFASAFAAFFSRAYDFIRMGAISRASIRIAGSHAGVATGEDGPSQMALEDIAMFRAVHGSTVLYPSDANQTAKLVALAADNPGVTYLRTTRADTPVIYRSGAEFEIGGSRLVHASLHDAVTIAAAGITVHEAMEAALRLSDDGIYARVLDLYSVKPIDREALLDSLRATGGRLVTVEDHWPQGGLGDAVLEAVADSGLSLQVVKLAVRDLPGSGTPAELLHEAGIDADAIAAAVRSLLDPIPGR